MNPWEEYQSSTATVEEPKPWESFQESKPWESFAGKDYGVDTQAPEDSFVPSEHPIAENAVGGTLDTLGGFVPHSVKDVASFLTPAVQGVEGIKKGIEVAKALYEGHPLDSIAKEVIPESQQLNEVEKTPPYSRERFALGTNIVAQMLMAKGIAGHLGRSVKPSEVVEATSLPPEVQTQAGEPVGAVMQDVAESHNAQVPNPELGTETPTPQVLPPQETGNAQPVGLTDTLAKLTRDNASADPWSQYREAPQPEAAPEAVEQPSPTSIRNEQVDAERATRNLPPAMETWARDFPTVREEVLKRIDDDPQYQDKLIADLKENPRAHTDTEAAALLHRQIDLQNQFDKTANDLIVANGVNDFPKAAELDARMAKISDDLQDVYNIGKAAGTETGRGLNARKMMANEDFSLAKMIVKKRAARGGEPLKASELIEVKNKNGVIQDLQSKVDLKEQAAQLKAQQAEIKAHFDDLVKASTEEARNAKASKRGINEFLSEQADKARARIKARGGRLMTGIDPVDLADHAIIGADYIAKGLTEFGKWSAEMIRTLGDKINPYLKELWKQAQRLHKANEKAFRDPLAGAKKRAVGRIEELQTKMAQGDFSKSIRKPKQIDPELQNIRAKLERTKQDFQKELARDQYNKSPTVVKMLHHVSGLARASALSGYHTLGKLAGFSIGKLLEAPFVEGAGQVVQRMPGFRRIASKANFESGSAVKSLATFYAKTATKGVAEAMRVLKSGRSNEEALHGKLYKAPVHFYDYFGQAHGAEKTPIFTGAMEMYRSKAFEHAIRNGINPNDPIVRAMINQKSFEYAMRDKLQENNKFADMVNAAHARLEAIDPATGRASIEKTLLSTIIKTFVTKGIVRTPANYLMQTLFQRSPIGLVRGISKTVASHIRGVDKLTESETNNIMRLIKLGAVGTAMTLWGAYDATKDPQDRIFGGYYQPGDKRNSDDVPFGKIKIGGKALPHWATHNTLTEPAQMGSTFMRVARAMTKKYGGQEKGYLTGLFSAALSPVQNAPIVNPITRVMEANRNGGKDKIIGDIVKGLIPQLVQNIAEDTDTEVAEPVPYRKPKGLEDQIKMAVPGYRQEVPLQFRPR